MEQFTFSQLSPKVVPKTFNPKHAMTISNSILSLIAGRFRDTEKPKITQAEMAAHMGYGKAWASKFMHGGIRNIDDDQADKLEKFLGIPLRPYMAAKVGGESVPVLAVQLGKKMRESEPITRIVKALLEIDQPIKGPRWIDTQDMTKVGQEIIRIAFANEDKPGKVARMVLELLSSE